VREDNTLASALSATPARFCQTASGILRAMRFTFDRRELDSNGHLHVPNCRITCATVNAYAFDEVPGADSRGFRRGDTIPVYRDSEELQKALQTFESVPLMMEHIVSTADDPKKDYIVGTVSNPRYEHPHLYADLTVWDQAGIDLITSGEQKELSAGYTNELDWTPGEKDGLQYAARMFNIKCNHVALVKKGRVTGAVVADKAPEVSMFDNLKFPKIVAAILSALGGEKKEEQALALDAALDSELKEVEVVHAKKKKKGSEETDGPSASADAEDEHAGVGAGHGEGITGGEANAEKKKKKEEDDKKTMDEAINAAVETAVADAEKRVHALYAARESVAPVVGVVSMDSAEAVYRFALDKVGVAHANVTADGLGALWEAANKRSPVVTADADVADFDVHNLFPGLRLIRKG
jgi:uncharacterized protein